MFWLVLAIPHPIRRRIVQYLRARDYPALLEINEFYLCNFRAVHLLEPGGLPVAAQTATYFELCVFDTAGYVMSVLKYVCVQTTRIVFLGVVYDPVLRRVEVPHSKLERVKALLHYATKNNQ